MGAIDTVILELKTTMMKGNLGVSARRETTAGDNIGARDTPDCAVTPAVVYSILSTFVFKNKTGMILRRRLCDMKRSHVFAFFPGQLVDAEVPAIKAPGAGHHISQVTGSRPMNSRVCEL